MNKFADKNALFDIIQEVRDGAISNKKGIKKIFALLLSLHGSVGVIDGEVIYNPNEYAYLDYVDKTSSVITMPDGSGNSMTRSMRMAILEDAQQWEIRVGEQICSQLNAGMKDFELENRMLLLDQLINGMTIPSISEKYGISRQKIYKQTKMIRNALSITFNLYDRDSEEEYNKVVQKYIESSVETPLKKTCQEIIETNLEIIDWEKSL